MKSTILSFASNTRMPAKYFDLGREASGVIDRAIDLETVTLADDEVVVTVSGRGVNAARTGLAVGRLLFALR